MLIYVCKLLGSNNIIKLLPHCDYGGHKLLKKQVVGCEPSETEIGFHFQKKAGEHKFETNEFNQGKKDIRHYYRNQRVRREDKCSYSGGNEYIAVRQQKKLKLSATILRYLSLTLSDKKLRTKEGEDYNMNLNPPSEVKGMKILDRERFKKQFKVPAIFVPVKSVSIIAKYLKRSLLHIPKVKNIAELDSNDPDYDKFKVFLIDPAKKPDVHSFDKDEIDFLNKHDLDLSTWKLYNIELNYENWTFAEIMKVVIPEDSDRVAGFSTIGHIAHVNLRESLSDYKNIIGDVIIDKINQVTTVVNKLNTIDNTYRNFAMEVIAGEENFITTTKEHGNTFQFDFSKVYWNPRLGTEHERITKAVSKEDILYDVFAGVGPFSVPAAKKGCKVFANDLNPESYKWLEINMKTNKVKSEPQLYNLDGREFIRNIVKPDLVEQWQRREGVIPKLHIVMNLPALAVEFLDVFPGLFNGNDPHDLPTWVPPTVYCHCFSKAENPEEDAKAQVETVLKKPLPLGYRIRRVRDVAPNKEMLCVIFKLEEDLLFQDTPSVIEDTGNSPPTKRMRNDDVDS